MFLIQPVHSEHSLQILLLSFYQTATLQSEEGSLHLLKRFKLLAIS